MPTALAIAKTAWFVLCLTSCFAINNLIVLLILSLYITVSQHFKCPTLSWRDFCLVVIALQKFIYFGFSAFCRFSISTPFLQANPDVEDCHTKCFGEVSSRKQFGLKTNCVCSKLGNAASQKSKCLLFISANTHISGSIWISTQLDFNNIRLLLASHMAPACN